MSENRRSEEKKEELRNARTGHGHEEGINDLRLPSEPNPFPPFLTNSQVLRLFFAIDNFSHVAKLTQSLNIVQLKREKRYGKNKGWKIKLTCI